MYTMSEKSLFCALISLSIVKLAALIICRRKKLRKFEKVGSLAAVYQYPLKSGGLIHLDSATCTSVGLLHDDITDRTWMAIRQDGSFLSARVEPKLVLIKPSSDGNKLRLEAPGMPPLYLPKFPEISAQSKLIKCRVWDEYITGLHCGTEAEKWIGRFLNSDGVCIVTSTSNMEKREASLVYKPTGNPAKEGDVAAFADWAAYMVLSEASVEDLNTRIQNQVTMTQFRPNIIITGCAPYDEENWSEMRIGEKVYIRLLDLCSRCTLTTVDPLKGEKDPQGQPLETLKSYRYFDEFQAPCFGVNAALDIGGIIKVGDPVYVLRRT